MNRNKIKHTIILNKQYFLLTSELRSRLCSRPVWTEKKIFFFVIKPHRTWCSGLSNKAIMGVHKVLYPLRMFFFFTKVKAKGIIPFYGWLLAITGRPSYQCIVLFGRLLIFYYFLFGTPRYEYKMASSRSGQYVLFS